MIPIFDIPDFTYVATESQTVPGRPAPRKIRVYQKREMKYNCGRNEPCPCGSGKKFKKCCINAQKKQVEQSTGQ